MRSIHALRRAAEAGALLASLSLLATGGCSSSEGERGASIQGGKPAPVAAAPVRFDTVQGFPELAASSTPPNLTEAGSWARGSAEPEVMDTRTFPQQIQAMDFAGEPTLIKHTLPPHHRQRTIRNGAPNGLVAGEITGKATTKGGALFPALDQTPWSPPDPTLAVGLNHVVQTVNMDIAWYDKQGNEQFRARLDSTGNPGFFETIGAGNFTFDPKCFYDHLEDRFIVVALEVYTNQAWIDIAVSDDGDPNGTWYKYRTDARVNVGGNLYWVDYPGLGFDGEAYYVNGNLFPLNNGGFGGVLFRSFDKSALLSGQTAVYTDVRNGNAGSVQAAQHFGANPTPYFVEHWSTTSLMLTAIRNPLSAPQIVTRELTVPAWSYPSGGAPNNGGFLDVLDARMINAMWRDGSLVTGHGVRIGGKNQSRWYEIATNGWPDSGQNPTLLQSGNIDGGSGVHTWFPALYSNDAGAIGLVTAASSSSQYASVQYTGRKQSDPAGTMGALTVAKIGSAAADGRWGDYFDMALDPDGRTFWLCGEYYEGAGWGTWISSFTVSCPADFNGDGVVNTQDVLAFLNVWAAGDPDADWNGDGAVNTQDVLAFLNEY
ncbi:MAG TPA: GC-type dockerin domain-anchored protein, partial [Phycisphaerales bacterium]|nr:GC-type dockerin domain-anchored protein [Phycisphaerales bacterium]